MSCIVTGALGGGGGTAIVGMAQELDGGCGGLVPGRYAF